MSGAVNREGLSLERWLAAAQREPTPEAIRAWQAGEDPAERRLTRMATRPFVPVTVGELQELAEVYERFDPTVEILASPLRGEARLARPCGRGGLHLLEEN